MTKDKDKDKENITGAKHDSVDLPEPPERAGSSDVLPPPPPGPRIGRFGSGPEGSGGRRERGESQQTDNFFSRAAQFLHDVRVEMRRVTWPTGNEVYKTTVITIVAVIFFAVYLFAVDRVWAFFIEQLDRLLNMLTGAA